MSPSNMLQNGGGGGCGNRLNYIEHPVSKLDTLAGVAIKYGVEVADIKRINGLATDLQMFALKTLRIPLPGRHPPSHSLPNGSAKSGDITEGRRHIAQSSIQEPFLSVRPKAPRQKISPAMSSLQNYYGLMSSNPRGAAEGTEMALYKSGSSNPSRDEWLPRASPISDPPSNYHYGSRNLSYDLLSKNGSMSQYVPLAEMGNGGSEKSDEKSVRRRQKADVDGGPSTPEMLLKEENNGATSGFSSSTGKSVAMRPKSASRTALLAESESGWLDSFSMGLGESMITESLLGVRKSSSTSSLKEQDKNTSTIWPTGRWGLKPDLHGRKNKAAVD